MNEPRPIVSLGVMILKDGKVLMGKRKGSDGAGDWGFPGGKIDHGETFEAAILREIGEEIGSVEIQNLRFVAVFNVRQYPPNHFVYLSFVADWKSGEAELKEPQKCEGWEWHDLKSLPEMNPTSPGGVCLEALLKNQNVREV